MPTMSPLVKALMLLGAGVLLLLLGVFIKSQDRTFSTPAAQSYAEQEQQGDLQHPPPVSIPSAPTSPSVLPVPSGAGADSLQHTLLSSNAIVGVEVNDSRGEKIGTLREIMLDPASGQLVYAMVDSVGLLGFGQQQSFAVPWNALQVKLDRTDVVVQLDPGRFPLRSGMALSRR